MIQYNNQHVTVFESQLFKTTSTVIQSSQCVVVVDPTWLPQEVDRIKKYVENVKGQREVYLLFTHSDFDHILGYGAFPSAKVIASEHFAKRDDKMKIIHEIKAFDDQYYMDRSYPLEYPQVDIIINKDGQTIDFEGLTLTFYLAQGHTNDGLIAAIEPYGILVAGDYLSDVEFPFIYHNSKAYQKTLLKMDEILEKHEIKLLIPGHGSVTEKISEIQKRKVESIQYIERLTKAIADGKEQHTKDLYQVYRYWRGGMEDVHMENINLIKNEQKEK